MKYLGLTKENMKYKDELFHETELTMTKILPGELKRLNNEKKIYGWYLNSFIKEFEKQKENNNDIKENILNYLKETKDNFASLK